MDKIEQWNEHRTMVEGMDRKALIVAKRNGTCHRIPPIGVKELSAKKG